MKTIGINSDFAFSLFLHALIIAATLIVVRHSNMSKSPVPYIVTIVDSAAVSSQPSAVSSKPPEAEVRDSKSQNVKPKAQSMDASTKLKDISKKDEMAVKERIEALQAKKRIEKMVSLRKMVDIDKISDQQSAVSSKGTKASSPTSKSQGHIGGDYYSMVVNRIKEQWIYPESIDKDLLTIVIIRIAKDGGITIDNIEKSSGNPLFDRSVLRAINKSSPLPPPPQEIEIGVRFRP